MKTIRGAVAFGAGLVFAIGLGVSGMTQPSKVIGFLDVAGSWDPSLAVVMASALAIHIVVYRWVRGRKAPLFDDEFHLPTRKTIDAPLVVGAILFGVGWGLAGYCPGPALVSAAALSRTALVFTAAMVVGMGLYALVDRALQVDRGQARVGDVPAP